MSNLDILEVALNNINLKLASFYHLIADIDTRLANTNNYLLDNSAVLNPIFSNIDEQSIFTSYSEASQETRTAPIRLEDIHLRTTKPTLNTPEEPIQTCNVLISPITFSNFNQYFTSTLGDTLHFYVTDLEIPRPSFELECNFITTGLDLIRYSNFKISNDFFIIQPDFRDQTIDINIRALDASNINKFEIYDNCNYLSDPYTIRIVESTVSSIIKISPENNSNIITFPHTNYHIRNNLNVPVLFLQTFINSTEQSTIVTIDNITSIYYEYELPLKNVVFSNVAHEHYSNFNQNYYYTFDFRGSNNEPKQTKLEVITYDSLYYPYYQDKKTTTYVTIEEPPPITLINGTSSNITETQGGYNTFEFNYVDLFSNNVNISQSNIGYSNTNPNSTNPSRFYTDITHLKHCNIKQNSPTIITINTDYRNTTYSIVITAKELTYLELPTYYTINVTELPPPPPTITPAKPHIFENSIESNFSTINLSTYFTSGTSNLTLEFKFKPDDEYPTDTYADLFTILSNNLKIQQDKYFSSSRTLKKTVIATDTLYGVYSSIEFTFNQKPLISITHNIVNLNDIDIAQEISIDNYLTFNLQSVKNTITTTIISNIVVPEPRGHAIPLITHKTNLQFTINPDYREEQYTLSVNVIPNDALYSSFSFNFDIIVKEKQLSPPYIIYNFDKFNTRKHVLSNIDLDVTLNTIFCNTIRNFDLAYFVSPINTSNYDINGNTITFTPNYRDISYNIEIIASNIEYNMGSIDVFRINIIEKNPIKSLADFPDITTNDVHTLELNEYFQPNVDHINNINFTIKYLDILTKTEISIRSNIDHANNPATITDNRLIIIPNFRNITYLIEIEAIHNNYDEAKLIKFITVFEHIKPTIDMIKTTDTILTTTQDYFTLELSNYFDLRYYLNYDNVQLQFEYEIEYKQDVIIKLIYVNNKLYYANSFEPLVFSRAYKNITYNIHTEVQLKLYNSNRIKIATSTNNILNYEATRLGKIYDNVSSLTHLFEVENRNIKTYIDDPILFVDGNKGKSIITDSINLSNLSDDSSPIKFTVNIYNILSASPIKLNTDTLILDRPIFIPKLVANLRYTQSIHNMVTLIGRDNDEDTSNYNFSFSILTDSNLYCNTIVELDNNSIKVNPYYRNDTHLVYIDVYDTRIEDISERLVYKFIELPVLELKSYTDTFYFTSNQYIFDYSNFIINNAPEFTIELNITVESNTTYIPIDDYNIRTTRNGNPFHNIQNKQITINPDFRNNTYDLKLLFNVINLATDAINSNITVPLKIIEEKIPSIIYNLVPPNFNITNNESNQLFELKERYTYKYPDYLNFNVLFETFNNTNISNINSNLYIKFDYHNCNYNVIIEATDTYYLPYESNISLILNINEQKTIEDISSLYNFIQFSNIYTTHCNIDMTQLFSNLTHYSDTYQQFNITLSNNKYDQVALYYNTTDSNLTITPNGRGEEYYITIESYMNGSSHYEDQKLSKTFNIIELPVINIKPYSSTNPLYFSNIYDVYSCNYPFYNNLEIEHSISKTNKYIDNFKYIPDIIQYNVSDTINTTSYTYVEDTRGIEYNVSFDINVIGFKNETLNSNFNFSVIEDAPIEYTDGSNQTISQYNDSINITSKFRNNTTCNLIIHFIGGYEITSNVEYNEATNYISKYLINTYTFTPDIQASSAEQPNISTNVYNPINTQITKNITNVVFGFWCKNSFDINLEIHESNTNINYTTTNWFYALILYIPSSNSINIYNNMDLISNINDVSTTQDFENYSIKFNSSNLVSKLSFFSNMDERTHNALINNIKTDLSFTADNPFRFGKESTLAFNYNTSTTDLDIILANSGKKYELLFDAYIENYNNFKKLEYYVTIQENAVFIPVGGLSPDKIYSKSMSLHITEPLQFNTPEKLENVRQSIIKSVVSKKFSKDTTIDPTALENSLTKSIVLEVIDDKLVITVNPDISQSTTTDEYIADIIAIVGSGEQTTEPLEIVSQSIVLENLDYTALTSDDKAIIIEKTKEVIRNTNLELIDHDDIIVTLSGNGDKVITSVAIKATVETAQTIKEGLEKTPNLAKQIIENVISAKAGHAPVIPSPTTSGPISVKDTILTIILNNIIYIEDDKSIFKTIITEELSSEDRTIETQITPTQDNYVNIVISIKTPTAPTEPYYVVALSTTIKNEYLSRKSTIIKVPTISTIVGTIKQITSKTIQSFDITLKGVDFDGLTENDKKYLIELTRTKVENSNLGKTIKDIKILKSADGQGVIIKIIYETDETDAVNIPTDTDTIVTDFKAKKKLTQDKLSDANLIIEIQATEGNEVKTIIKIDNIVDGDLDEESVINAIKDQVSRKTGELPENIEVDIQYKDNDEEDPYMEITITITTPNTDAISDIMTNHPSLQSSLITEIKNTEKTYSNSPEDITSSVSTHVIITPKSVTELKLSLPYIDIQNEDNHELIKTKINDHFTEIPEEDITITFNSDTDKVIVSIRHDADTDIPELDAETLQNDIINTELKAKNVLEEESTFNTAPTTTTPLSIEKETISFEFVSVADHRLIDIEIIKNKVNKDTGIDPTDVVVEILEDGTVKVYVSYTSEDGVVDTLKNIVSDAISTSITDTKLGFISDDSFSLEAATTQPQQQPPQQSSTTLDKDIVEFTLKISSVDYSEMNEDELSSLRTEIKIILLETFDEDTVNIVLENIGFSIGSLKITMKIELAPTVEGIYKTLKVDVFNKLNDIFDDDADDGKTTKQHIATRILESFNTKPGLRAKLEPGKTDEDIGIEVVSENIIKKSSNQFQVKSIITFPATAINFDIITGTLNTQIKTLTQNIIHNSIESASATVSLSANEVTISVSTNKGVFGIDALRTSLDELSDSIQSAITAIIIAQTGSDPGPGITAIKIDEYTTTSLPGIGSISSSDELIYNKDLGNILLIDYINKINVSDYIELTGLEYEIITGPQDIVSVENEQFIIINEGNSNTHTIEIHGIKQSINAKIIFNFNIVESHETSINLSGDSNLSHYPLIFEQKYLLTDFYNYYRKDYLNYYICNLDNNPNVNINANNELIIQPVNNKSQYNFTIKAEDPHKSFTNEDITFTIKTVKNVDSTTGAIKTPSTTHISKTIIDEIESYDFLTLYTLDKEDSNILSVDTRIEDTTPELLDLIESNINISTTNMVLTIKPTNITLNYKIRLYVAYKDLTTGNEINRFNSSIRYYIEETGVFTFLSNPNVLTLTYPLINLTNNEITCNLISNITLHYPSLDIYDIKFSNINPSLLDDAHYKYNIYSNAYILDDNNQELTFSGEYRNSNYTIEIQAYFEEYSNVKLTQIYQIQEAEIPQILLNDSEQILYTYIGQSNQVIYLSNIFSLYNYLYSNELEITYTFEPPTITNANPYNCSLTTDTLRIDTDYRGNTYNINIIVTDTNFNRTNNAIIISITEIEPFVFKTLGGDTFNKTFNGLTNNRLLISLNEYYDINIPVNKINSININNNNLTNIDINGNTYESNINNDIITLTFDYRTILTVTNKTTDKISLTTTTNTNIIITGSGSTFNSSYFIAESNNDNISSCNIITPTTPRSHYQYIENDYFIWNTKNVKLYTEYYIINYSEYDKGNNTYFIIKFTDINDTNYNKIIKTLNYDTSIRDVFYELTINSNVIVQQTEYENSFNYNANYRNSNISVEVILSNIDYPYQIKNINFTFSEVSLGDIEYNNIEIKLVASNTNILTYNLYEVYCNNDEFDKITYSVFDPPNTDSYITFENCNIFVQPNFRGRTYDIFIKAEDTSFEINNSNFSINIEEYAPLKFNQGFNSNIVINNLSNISIIRNIFNNITVYATHCNLIFSNSYLSNCLDTNFGHYNSLKLFSNPIDSPTYPYDQVDSNIYNISFNPEYRNKTYEIGYNIYMSGYEEQYIQVKFILTEINIPQIEKLASTSLIIPKIYESNIPDIINLSDLYNYPYSNELKFNIISTSKYSYNNGNILTITPDFRNEIYPLNIEAYDPYFTNETFQNSSNNVINYNITEKPPLEFNSIPSTTFIYNVNNDGSSKYVFEDSYDRNKSITGENPDITVYIGDKIEFIRTTTEHPIHIKKNNSQNIALQTNNKTTYTFITIDTYEYYCASSHSDMKGTINVIAIPLLNQRYIEYNLGREEKHFNIIDNVTIYATHCNIIIDNITTLDPDTVRTAYYNETYSNAITVSNSSNLTIASEHRGINYENTFNIYMTGYPTQQITKTFNINELSIPYITNNNNTYTSTKYETKTFILQNLYDYPYADELVFSITDSKQKLKTANTFESNINQAIIHGLSNINNQSNLFIDLAIDEQEFKFTIKAEDTRFDLENDSLTITIVKDTPINFNIDAFTNQLMVNTNITNMSNSITIIDLFDQYVSNIDEGNILVIEPMHEHNPNINGRLAYYQDYYPTYNEGKPYKILDSNVYFLPEYRGNTYSNIFKLYARNVECNINYDSYYLQVNCICSEIQVPAIEFNSNKETIFTSLPIQFNSITEESYDLSTLYTYPYLNYLNFDYTVEPYIPYSNTVMEQSNLHIILKPKLRGKHYTITINTYDNNFQISNLELDVDINEIPAIKFKAESEYINSNFNTKTITINDLTNTQIICNLESYIDNIAETTILFSNIFPPITEVRNAHYDTTVNKNALIRANTTITDANIINITTDTIELHNDKDSYRVDNNITESINLINKKEFSVAFNVYFTGVSIETEYFSINGFDDDGAEQTILKCKVDTHNNIKFETNLLTTIEHNIGSTNDWKHIVFNVKTNERQLYINNFIVETENNGFNNEFDNINITINSNIEYFQSFRVIDKPLTENDIDYLYNNQTNTLFYENSNLYINPEYRNKTYTAQVVLTTTGYEEISRTLEFIITENEIPAIVLKSEYSIIANYTYCNLLNHTCNIQNISDFYNYPFSNHLIFATSTNKQIGSYNTNKDYVISTNNALNITADYRDMDYIVTLIATDHADKFNLVNSDFKVFIHEKPPIEFNNFELTNAEYLTNLENTELTCNIYDNIIINVDFKYVSNLSYTYTASRTDIRTAFYNKTDDDTGKNAYNVNDSNLEIIPEYRNQNYSLDFKIYIEGYKTQIITKIYDITECNIPPIVIDQTVNSNFVGLSNEPFINNDLADYFTTYPFKNSLKFIIIEPKDIPNRKTFTENITFSTESIQNRQIKVIPDFRDSTYRIKLLIYDLNFSYLNDNGNYTSASGHYDITDFKSKDIASSIEDLNNNKANDNYSSNNVNESLDLYFTEIPPIEFNNTIDIIYYCNLTKNTEICNIYPNIKFNAPEAPIITTSNYITSIPDRAFYKHVDELNAISITDISNINIYPEYRNTSYSINIDIEHSTYPNQKITQTFFIHECNIPNIDFKYPNITFQHLEEQTTAINLLSNNDLKEYFNYPFLNELVYSCNITIITQDIPQELIRSPDITIRNSNITILPDFKGYMYAVEITATDINFGISNSEFIITISEKAPIELRNSDNIYSNFIVIDNLSNVNYIISSETIYNRNYTRNYNVSSATTFVRKEVHSDSSNITDFKYRDPNVPAVSFAATTLIISPYYRDVNYNYVYDISIDNNDDARVSQHKYNYFKLKLVLNITELPIPAINVISDTKEIYYNLSNNEITIPALQSLYDYPFREYLQFYYSNSESGSQGKEYDITLTESNLTVIAGLRDQTYTLTLQAYDPLFTYYSHHDDLSSNTTNSNLINEELQFEFQELPAIRFIDTSQLSKTIHIDTTGNTQCNINLLDFVEIFTDHSNFMLSNASTLPRPAHYIEGDYSNAVFFGHPTNGIVSTTDTLIYINPEYRGIDYTVNIDIYMSNFAENIITLSLHITEVSIDLINVNSDTKEIYYNLSNNEITIPALQSLYNYPFSNHLQFNYSNSESGEYDITLTESNLTVIAGLRDQTYTLTLQAYDPLFTYYSHHDDLSSNTTNSNLINEELQFEFQELPAIRFIDTSQLSKTIHIDTTGNTQCNINLLDFVEIFTDHSNFMLSNASTLPRDAHYIEDDYSNAVFFGHPTNGIVSTTDTLIYINPEYRGISYTINIDIYMSNYQDNTITLSLYIAEETIGVINDNFLSVDPTTPRPLLITEDIISNLKSKYNYVYSNQLQFNYSVTELNGPALGHSVVLDGDTLTVYPNLRGNSYTVQIIAYDPKFTSNAELPLAPIDDYCNLINDRLTFTFTESPSIYFSNMDNSNLSKTISIYAPNNTQIECNLTDILAIEEIIETVYIIGDLHEYPAQDKAHYLSGNNSNAVYIGDFVDSNPIIYINPEYRGNTTYSVSFDIYASNFATRKLTVTLDITEETIHLIDVNSAAKEIYCNLSNNEITIPALQSLYNYPFREYLQFYYSNSESESEGKEYDITLTESNLTVIAGLRDKTYTLTLRAYDPLFTYHHDINYVNCNLTSNTTNSNLINEELQFEFRELPAIRFKDTSHLSKTINIITSGNTQCNINLLDFVEIFTDHSNFMLSNASTLPRDAHYIEDDYSNAVFFGHPTNGIVSTTDTLIYINPEYRGIGYTVNIDIYMSNYQDNTITLSLHITEENIPVIDDNFSSVVRTRPILLFNEDSISNLKSNYNYVYSNQLQFTCNVIELNEPELGHSVVLDGDTLTVYPNLRGNSYKVEIIAYDPNFTSYAELPLAPIDDYCNLINDRLTFTFTETPSIYFKNMDYSNLSNTISIYAPNNTQIECNLRDILTFENTANVYIIENLTGVSADNEAHYLSGNNRNAVYIGDFVDNIFTIHADPIIYINPEYRGNTTYRVSFDIYSSNFAARKLTVNLDITEETIPVIDDNFSSVVRTRPILLFNEDSISNLKSNYNYVYSNQLQFTCNVIELNEPELGHSVVLDGDTLTVYPNLRGNSYNVQIIAYDPNFTSYAELPLAPIDDYCNLVNDSLIFTFEETPSIYFKNMDYSNLSKTISIYAPNNTQIECNLRDILTFEKYRKCIYYRKFNWSKCR